MSEQKDFFISYNHNDEVWAKWIAGTLEERGYTTIIQAWDFLPGNNFVNEMNKASESCKKIILVLSENYLKSDFCEAEWNKFFRDDPTGEKRKIIPVKVSEINPEGLLSTIVCVDLVEKNEKVAIQELLTITEEGKPKRIKPSFPMFDASPVSKKETSYVFVFKINKEGFSEPIELQTKNAMRTWYMDSEKSPFEVRIEDKREESINRQIDELNEKIENNFELSDKEEKWFAVLGKGKKRLERENQLKRCAIEFFLKDLYVQSYLNCDTYLDLYKIMKTILDYDYHNDFNMLINKYGYSKIDVYLSPAPKECCDHFVVPIKDSKLKELFGDINTFSIWGYVPDLQSENVKDIVKYFYLFLAEEFVIRNHRDLVNNPKVLNLLNYRIGLH